MEQWEQCTVTVIAGVVAAVSKTAKYFSICLGCCAAVCRHMANGVIGIEQVHWIYWKMHRRVQYSSHLSVCKNVENLWAMNLMCAFECGMPDVCIVLLCDLFQSTTLPISLYCCDFMEFDKYVVSYLLTCAVVNNVLLEARSFAVAQLLCVKWH